jgi:hypothetical protein
MAAYRVVCVEWQTFDDGHRHIVAVGTGDDPGKAEERWTMTEVLFSMRFGQDRFYTEDADGGSAGVERAVCDDCGARTVGTVAGAVGTQTLRTLRPCRFR